MIKNKNTTYNLNYRVIGNGYPVVFLHGFLEDLSMWNFVHTNTPGLQYIFIDLPGHGNSLNNVPSTKLEEIASEVYTLLLTLKINNYLMIGHSLGGYVGLELFKTTNPPKELCLLNSHPFEDSPERKESRLRLLNILDSKKNAFLEEAIPNLFLNPELFKEEIEKTIAVAKTMKTVSIKNTLIALRNREDYSIALSNILKPGEISSVQGKNDRLLNLNRINEWCSNNWFENTVITNTAHMPHIEKKQRVIEILNEFIKHAMGL